MNEGGRRVSLCLSFLECLARCFSGETVEQLKWESVRWIGGSVVAIFPSDGAPSFQVPG